VSIPVSHALKSYLCKKLIDSLTANNKLIYRSEHKYEVPTGHATFWNHIIDSVDFLEDNLKVPKVTNAFVDTLYKNKIPIKRCVCSFVSMHY
jgi:hypothetical protein